MAILVLCVLGALNATFAPDMPRAGSPIAGSLPASPIAELDCPGAGAYLQTVSDALAPVDSEIDEGLFGGWRYAETSDLSGHEFALLSATYKNGHDAWLAIEPPVWATDFHTAVDAYFGLVINATLAASTRGVYAMGAYTVVIETARHSVIAELELLATNCPATASALADVLGIELSGAPATPAN
jgi:hypothetical protein